MRVADGWSISELRAAFGKVMVRFPAVVSVPAALVETYALLGRRPDVTSNQDRPLHPTGLFLDNTGEVLVTRRENQGCAQWGIRVDDLCHDDPPVVMRTAGPERGWQPYADRWSVACIEMVLFESLWSRADLSTDVELDDHTMAMVEQRFTPVPVPALPHWTLPEVRWLAGPDVLLRNEAQTWLWVRAHTGRALADIQRTLHG